MLNAVSKSVTEQPHTTKLVLLRHGQSIWNRDKKFTGWSDVPLSPKGEQEAEQAAYLLKQAGFSFDVCFTSALQRATTTARIVLSSMQLDVPLQQSWRLNERHYGALEGMERWSAIKQFGVWPILGCQIKFDAIPPRLSQEDPRYPGNQPLYTAIDSNDLPTGESMQQTLVRLRPYWQQTILPEIQQGKRVLIVSHRNTLRVLMMLLDHLSPLQVMKQKLATGRPLVYEMDQQGQAIRHYYVDTLV